MVGDLDRLAGNDPTLTTYHLVTCPGLSPEALAIRLAASLPSNTYLTTVRTGSTAPWPATVCLTIAEALSKCRSLTTVSVTGPADDLLTAWWQQKPTVSRLHLSAMTLSLSMVPILADYLARTGSLHELRLIDVDMSNNNAMTLQWALQQNKSIRRVAFLPNIDPYHANETSSLALKTAVLRGLMGHTMESLIVDDRSPALVDFLSATRTLQHLDLRLTESQGGCHHADIFAAIPANLQQLGLNLNKLAYGDMSALLLRLGNLSQLQDLILIGLEQTSRYHLLASALADHPSLQRVQVKARGMGACELAQSASVLLQQRPRLSHLKLHPHMWHPQVTPIITKGVAASQLQSLDMTGCLGLDIKELLRVCLRPTSSIQQLKLAAIGMRYQDLAYLMQCLPQSRCEELVLDNNPLGGEACCLLADHLASGVCPLRTLSIGSDFMTDLQLARLLSAVDVLESFTLVAGTTGPQCKELLVGGLPSMRRLLRLSMPWFKDAASVSDEHLLASFRANTSLVKVEFTKLTNLDLLLRQELALILDRNRFAPLLLRCLPVSLWPQALSRLSRLNTESSLYRTLSVKMPLLLPHQRAHHESNQEDRMVMDD